MFISVFLILKNGVRLLQILYNIFFSNILKKYLPKRVEIVFPFV